MKRTRMAVALIAGVLALGLLATPAFAKEAPVFGKFKATVTGTTKGKGEAGEMRLGPYKFEECERELKATGSVTMLESETFFQEIKFSHCETSRNIGPLLEETVFATFTLGIEFHSNGSMKIGPTPVTLKAGNSECELTIPSQWVPGQAESKPERHFEAAEYETETEELEGAQAKKFGQFRERLDISWELKNITTTVKQTPECKYTGSHVNEAGEAVFGGGKMEGELEEVTLQGGNLSFVEPV
jgi:hypothetical protein